MVKGKKQSGGLKFKEYYGEWLRRLKKNLLPVLQRSMGGESETKLSNNVEMVHQHFQSYYHALDEATTSDPSQVISQEWRNSVEKPLLWLGDLHPSLFTYLARSLLHEQDPDSDSDSNSNLDSNSTRPWQISRAWRNPSDSLTSRMDQIECGLRSIVPSLSARLHRADLAFLHRSVPSWFPSRGHHSSKLAADLKAHTEELVSVYLYANRLRRNVLLDIISATTLYQSALFLEALSQFLISFTHYSKPTPLSRPPCH